jgi:hypothetical protein
MLILVCAVLALLIVSATAVMLFAAGRAPDGYEVESGFRRGALPRPERSAAFDPVMTHANRATPKPRFRARTLDQLSSASASKATIEILESPDPVAVAHRTFAVKS